MSSAAIPVLRRSIARLGLLSQASACTRISRAMTAEADMQTDEQQIRALVATWMAATKAGDVETVLGLMTEDAVFLVPGKPAMRKSEFAAAARAKATGNAPTFDGSSDIQEVQVSGDWAFMWSKLT